MAEETKKPSVEERLAALEEKVFGIKEEPAPAPPEHIPDITLEEAKKLGKDGWHETGDGRFTKVVKGKRVSIDADEHAELVGAK